MGGGRIHMDTIHILWWQDTYGGRYPNGFGDITNLGDWMQNAGEFLWFIRLMAIQEFV
jgi:hypothetical protein